MKSIVRKGSTLVQFGAKDEQRWLMLCRVVFEESDPDRITEIVSELNLIARRRRALRSGRLRSDKPEA